MRRRSCRRLLRVRLAGAETIGPEAALSQPSADCNSGPAVVGVVGTHAGHAVVVQPRAVAGFYEGVAGLAGGPAVDADDVCVWCRDLEVPAGEAPAHIGAKAEVTYLGHGEKTSKKWETPLARATDVDGVYGTAGGGCAD